MDADEPECVMPELPSELRRSLHGYDWCPIAIGESRAKVQRLSAPGKAALILKSQRREALFGLRGEAERLHWLQGRVPVPAVVKYVEDATHDHLLMSALPGEDAATVKLDPDRLVGVLAKALRELHAVAIQSCPFVHTANELIHRAEAVMTAGEVDEDNLDPANMGRPPAELFAEMVAGRPESEDLVFTHGDFCLPNVMVCDGHLSGFIDVGTAGIGDRYRDLALVGRSMTRNLGAEWVEVFFERYGLNEPDRGKLHYYRLLDEFF